MNPMPSGEGYLSIRQRHPKYKGVRYNLINIFLIIKNIVVKVLNL